MLSFCLGDIIKSSFKLFIYHKGGLTLRNIDLAAVLLLLTLAGCNSDNLHRDAEKEILALERSALDKWAQSNTMGYVDIGADDITWFDFNEGEQQRIEGLASVRQFLKPLNGQIPPHTYEIVNPKIQLYENCAILTFHGKALKTDGTALPTWKATSVHYWKDGKWQQVHAHWSEVYG